MTRDESINNAHEDRLIVPDKEHYCPICDGNAQEIVVEDEIKTFCENCGCIEMWDEVL